VTVDTNYSSDSLISGDNLESICELVRNAERFRTTVEMQFKDAKLYKVQSNATSPRRNSVDSRHLLTLQQLLELEPNRKWKMKEQCILSAVLAKSLLDFSGSKWAPGWTSMGISFLINTDARAAVDFRQPCLVTDFSNVIVRDETIENRTSCAPPHPCPLLLQFAIVLLEVNKGMTIEKMRTQEDLTNGTCNENTDLMTADRILRDLVDDLSDGYWKALQACIQIQYYCGSEDCSFDNPKFRDVVYQRIVAPIKKDLFQRFHINIDTLNTERRE
jgi:hypothetical protein